MTVSYNKHGLQTAALVCGVGAWPTRFGEPPPRGPQDVAGTTATSIGVHVGCHAQNSFSPPVMPAGQSQRVGSYYHKTGCLQDRVREGFRETKGVCTLTEAPLANYGTIRKVGKLLLNNPPTAAMMTPRDQHLRLSARSGPASSGVSAEKASLGRSAPRSARGGDPLASTDPQSVLQDCLSARSGRRSSASSALPARNAAWNFEPLPFYEKQSETIGRQARMQDTLPVRPAGKSESGFMSPAELVATLTVKPYHDD